MEWFTKPRTKSPAKQLLLRKSDWKRKFPVQVTGTMVEDANVNMANFH